VSRNGERVASISDGCSVYPECITCPLVKCVFDESIHEQLRRARDGFIQSGLREGKTVREIAQSLNISFYTAKSAVEKMAIEDREGKRVDRKPYMKVEWVRVRV